jgi:hypothetical protein
MRHRRTEHPHNRIPDEFLHHAAVTLDLRLRHRRVGSQHPIDILRIRRLGRRRKADQIAEQGRHDLPLLPQRAGGSPQRGAALGAELVPTRVVVTTGRANSHHPSLCPRQSRGYVAESEA